MRSAYGRRYVPNVYDLAGGIQALRDCGEDPRTSRMRHTSAWVAKDLLAAAISSTEKLRQVADALDALDTEQGWDPRQSNIIHAYSDCDNYPPTLREVREKLVAKLDERNWPSEFSVRKTLKLLDLPLRKDKRGRPPGSRSKIGNRRRVEQ